jgi:thiosulfate dehydrogenase
MQNNKREIFMVKNKVLFALLLVLAFSIVGAGVSLVFSRFIKLNDTESVETIAQEKVVSQQGSSATPAKSIFAFNPPSPQDAPQDIKDAVLLGYNITINTRKYAAKYVGNKLTCGNCHFKGGMTEGGKNGGLSLVGVGAAYPKFRKRQNYSVDLVSRTNDCFERSMNGSPLPADSKEMMALVTYYQWISKGIPIYADIPWLGVKPLKSAYKPDTAKGKQVFAQKCANCHGANGQGTLAAPPLWGKDSFNDGAGMAKLDNFSAFTHLNMPLGNPDLSVEDALDVALFVTTESRPHFAEKTAQGS